MKGIREGEIVPKASIFYVFLIWEDNVITLIGYNDIQWIMDVAGVMITAPATVECAIANTAYVSPTVDQLHCSHKFSLVAIVVENPRLFSLGVKAHRA